MPNFPFIVLHQIILYLHTYRVGKTNLENQFEASRGCLGRTVSVWPIIGPQKVHMQLEVKISLPQRPPEASKGY